MSHCDITRLTWTLCKIYNIKRCVKHEFGLVFCENGRVEFGFNKFSAKLNSFFSRMVDPNSWSNNIFGQKLNLTEPLIVTLARFVYALSRNKVWNLFHWKCFLVKQVFQVKTYLYITTLATMKSHLELSWRLDLSTGSIKEACLYMLALSKKCGSICWIWLRRLALSIGSIQKDLFCPLTLSRKHILKELAGVEG